MIIVRLQLPKAQILEPGGIRMALISLINIFFSAFVNTYEACGFKKR